MKKSYLLSLALSALFAIVAITPAFGGGKKKPAPTVPSDTVISSVSANSITVMEDKVAKTFIISQFTEVNVNGQRATLAQLKPGMTVTVTMGTDPSRASRINATGK
jgi:hypothetical protein